MAKKKTTTRKPVQKRKPARRASSQRFRVLLAALFLTGFLILCLVVLGHLRQNWHSSNRQQAKQVVQAPALEDVQLELDNVLWRAGISFDRLKVISEPDLLRYEVRAPMPKRKVFKGLRKRLAKLSKQLKLKSERSKGLVTIRYEKDLLFLVKFDAARLAEPISDRPRVAIIVDDLGHDLRPAESLIEIPIPTTFAILPYPSQAAMIARLAHQHGREVIIHIPMEPRAYPAIDPGPEALLQTMDRKDLQFQLNKWLDLLPHVVGGNNHMGSLLTEQSGPMGAVMQVMKQRGLFFVDSKTTVDSVVEHEARRVGVPVVKRDVFLDNVREVPAIARQIQKLAGLARRQGAAVGICHPYPETLAALRQQADLLRQQGIEVVPVSKLLRPGNQPTIAKGG